MSTSRFTNEGTARPAPKSSVDTRADRTTKRPASPHGVKATSSHHPTHNAPSHQRSSSSALARMPTVTSVAPSSPSMYSQASTVYSIPPTCEDLEARVVPTVASYLPIRTRYLVGYFWEESNFFRHGDYIGRLPHEFSAIVPQDSVLNAYPFLQQSRDDMYSAPTQQLPESFTAVAWHALQLIQVARHACSFVPPAASKDTDYVTYLTMFITRTDILGYSLLYLPEFRLDQYPEQLQLCINEVIAFLDEVQKLQTFIRRLVASHPVPMSDSHGPKRSSSISSRRKEATHHHAEHNLDSLKRSASLSARRQEGTHHSDHLSNGQTENRANIKRLDYIYGPPLKPSPAPQTPAELLSARHPHLQEGTPLAGASVRGHHRTQSHPTSSGSHVALSDDQFSKGHHPRPSTGSQTTLVEYDPRASSDDSLAKPFTFPRDSHYAVQDGNLVCGTLAAIVHMLVAPQDVDIELCTTVMRTFRYFAEPETFFFELCSRYQDLLPDDLSPDKQTQWCGDQLLIQKRIAKIINDWVHIYWDNDKDRYIARGMLEFAQSHKEDLHTAIIWRDLVKTLNFYLRGVQPLPTAPEAPKKPVEESHKLLSRHFNIPSVLGKADDLLEDLYCFSKTELGRQEFASQLTVELAERFKALDPVQAVAYWRMEPVDRKVKFDAAKARPMEAISEFEKALTLFVTYSITKPKSADKRRGIILFWLSVAQRCLSHGNLSCACFIYTALDSSTIRRMARTILPIDSKHKGSFHKLQQHFHKPNTSLYRQALEKTSTPVIPAIPYLIQDLIHSAERERLGPKAAPLGHLDDPKKRALYKNQTSDGDVIIHLRSYEKMSDVIDNLKKACGQYTFTRNETFTKWFNSTNVMGRWKTTPDHLERDLQTFVYNRSLKREAQATIPTEIKKHDVWRTCLTGNLDSDDYKLTPLNGLAELSLTNAQREEKKNLIVEAMKWLARKK